MKQPDRHPHELKPGGLIREGALLAHYVPVSSQTLKRMVDREEFPRPKVVSKYIKAWKTDDVIAWMQSL